MSKLKLKHWIELPGEEVSSSNDGGGGGGGWLRFFFPHGKNTLFIRFQLPLLAIIDNKRIQGNNLPEKLPRFKLTADFPFLDQKFRWTEPRRKSVDCLSLRPVVKRRENPFPFDCGLPRSIVRTSAVFVTINSEADR